MQVRSLVLGLIIGVLLCVAFGGVVSIVADDDAPDAATGDTTSRYSIVVWGKLRLNETGDPDIAEKLLREKLLPAAQGVEGLKLTALKKKTVPMMGGKEGEPQPDFVMMAQLENVGAFLKLIGSTPGALREYGDQMKIQAGAPEFELYEIIGSTGP